MKATIKKIRAVARRLFRPIAAAATLLVAASAFADPVSFRSQSFFVTGGQDLQVFGTATNFYGQTNVIYKFNSTYGPGYSLGTYIYTVTNSLGVVEPVYGSYPLFTNQSGVVFTNPAVNPYTNATVLQPTYLWVDRDGAAPKSLNISYHLTSTNATGTNTITLRFAALVPSTMPFGSTFSPSTLGGSNAVSTSVNNLFSFSITSNGANDVAGTTNAPTAWLQGCPGVVCYEIDSPTANGGTNYVLRSLRLNGFY